MELRDWLDAGFPQTFNLEKTVSAERSKVRCSWTGLQSPPFGGQWLTACRVSVKDSGWGDCRSRRESFAHTAGGCMGSGVDAVDHAGFIVGF